MQDGRATVWPPGPDTTRVRACSAIRLPGLLSLGVFVYASVVLGQGVAASARAALYLAAVTIPIAALVVPRNERIDIATTLICLALGVSWPGAAALIGAAWLDAAFVMFLAGLGALWVAALAGWLRATRKQLPEEPAQARPDTRAALVALGLGALAMGPAVIYAVEMGRGEYPAAFFNIDNAYHLSQVRSILQDPTYPPRSLVVDGERRLYQYGAQSSAALLSSVSGLPAHTAYFGVLFPIYKLGAVAAAWRLACALLPAIPFWIAAGSMALLFRFPLDGSPLHALADLLAGHAPRAVNVAPLDHVPTHFGLLSAVLLTAALARPSARSLQRAAYGALALLPLFRMSFFLGLGAAFGAWSAAASARDRSLRPLVPGVLILGAAIVMLHALQLTTGDTAGGLTLAPLSHLHQLTAPIAARIREALALSPAPAAIAALWRTAVSQAAAFHWLLVAAIAALVIRSPGPRWAAWLSTVLAPVVLVNTLAYTRGTLDTAATRTNLHSAFNLVPFLTLGAVLALAAHAPRLAGARRRLVLDVLAAYVAILAIWQAAAAVTLLARPDRGYEYVDNRPLADVLRRIPTQSSVVVTNDLHYPADNYVRDNVQVQIPAIFGHRAYIVDAVNDRYASTAARLERQRRLCAPAWDPEIGALARREGWTHFLVKRDRPHPADIPLLLLYANDAYAVYSF